MFKPQVPSQDMFFFFFYLGEKAGDPTQPSQTRASLVRSPTALASGLTQAVGGAHPSPGNLAQDAGLLVRMLSQLLQPQTPFLGAAALAGPQALTHLGPDGREVQNHTGDIQLGWLSPVTCPPPGWSAGAQACSFL